MINYPNANKKIVKNTQESLQNKKKVSDKLHLSSMNRGMNFEDDINASNAYYLEKNMCLITKRPTPINVVKVDYSKGARIIDAYFEKQSTTDYNGVYKGKYIDFEAKSTKLKTSFPLANISPHQINHLKAVIKNDGIAFFIINFVSLKDEVYLLDAEYVINFYENGDRKSIPYEDIKKYGHFVKRGYNPRLEYLNVIEEVYFTKK